MAGLNDEDEYACLRCAGTKIRLWREGGSFRPYLRCLRCLSDEQGIPYGQCLLAATAVVGSSYHSYKFGNYVPAVQSPDGFWGLTSIPQSDLDLWNSLPVERFEPEPDLSRCDYYQGKGTCTFGCSESPQCVEDEPVEGWPSVRHGKILPRP